MTTVINYNRSLLVNTANGIAPPIVLPAAPAAPLLLLEFGLFIPPSSPVNFVELNATIGWQAFVTLPEDHPTVSFFIVQDGGLVGSANQECQSEITADSPIENTTAFQAILTNVSPGHHVYQLFGLNPTPAEGSIVVAGPCNISGTLYA